MKTLLKLPVGATRVRSIRCAAALLVSLSGCAGMRFPSTADRSTVHVSVPARECTTGSETAFSSDAPAKLERTARAAVGGARGALFGAVGGAATGFILAAALFPACVEPTTCSAGVGAIITIGAVAGGVAGAVEGARTSWRESSGVARNSHSCAAGPEIRSSGNSSSGATELLRGSRLEL